MKLKFLLLIFLCTFVTKGFSQETPVEVVPNADIDVTLKLLGKEGKPTGLTLPAVLNWDKEESMLQLEIKNIRFERPIYLFSGMMFIKDVSKIKKDLYFSKDIVKNAKPKKTVKSMGNDWLDNLQIEGVETGKGKGKAKMYNLCEPPGAVFKFKIKNQELGSCSMKLLLYIATIEKGKKAKSKTIVDATAEVNLNINLTDPCKNEDLLKIIELLDKKTFILADETFQINSETAELPGIPEKTVKTYKTKPAAKDKRINNIADPQFNKYKECQNLIATIEKYNAALDAHEKATNFYNNILDERKKTPAPAGGAPCSILKSANEKLMNLYYRIEQSNKVNYPALQAEYNKIKEQIEVNEKCKEFAAYKEWCKGIEKLLKK